MRLRLNLLALTILLLPIGHDALAQKGLAVGSFQSFKGMGLSFETLSPSGREFNTFTLYADLASVYLGENPYPGVKFNFSHNIRIAQFKPQTLDALRQRLLYRLGKGQRKRRLRPLRSAQRHLWSQSRLPVQNLFYSRHKP